MVRGITVLACMNTIQVVLMALYLARRDRPQLGKVRVNWRSSIWVGIFSVLGSACWALAMTLENAALVRAVGQIELVFTFIASHVVLKERPSGGEWIGSVLVVGGVVLILIFR
jgi:drug/metabolite transporter (DMT)-like permease